MTERVYIGGLVHEVTCEHFISVRDRAPEVKLDIVCGGYVTMSRDFDWRWDGLVTCLWCIAGSSRHRMDFIKLEVSI